MGKPERCTQAGVPEAEMEPWSKGEIARAELGRLRTAGVRFGTVLVDAGHGVEVEIRQALSEYSLLWPVGIPQAQKAMALPCRSRCQRAQAARPAR